MFGLSSTELPPFLFLSEPPGIGIYAHSFSSSSTAAHTKLFKPPASCWFRLYSHCISNLNVSHLVGGNGGEGRPRYVRTDSITLPFAEAKAVNTHEIYGAASTFKTLICHISTNKVTCSMFMRYKHLSAGM